MKLTMHEDIVDILTANYGGPTDDLTEVAHKILSIAYNLMTPVQVGEYLGVPKSNVQGWYRRQTNNLVIAQNTDGRSPQFYRPQVLEWAANNRNKIGWDAPIQEDL